MPDRKFNNEANDLLLGNRRNHHRVMDHFIKVLKGSLPKSY